MVLESWFSQFRADEMNENKSGLMSMKISSSMSKEMEKKFGLMSRNIKKKKKSYFMLIEENPAPYT